MAVQPIPEGYTTITPVLSIEGADRAIEFYKKALGAEERFRMPGPDGNVMHAELQVGSAVVMLGEAKPEFGCSGPRSLGGSPVSFYCYVKDVDAAFKRAVDSGGKQTMPVQDMFWGDRTGSFEDPFGHKWTLATHVREVTQEDVVKGQAEWIEKMSKAK